MIDLSDAPLWLIWAVAITAAATLLSAIYLLRRSRSSRGAGIALLLVSIVFHAALILGLPMLAQWGGGRFVTNDDTSDQPVGELDVSLSMFDTLDLTSDLATDASIEDTSDDLPLPLGPLPMTSLSSAIVPEEILESAPVELPATIPSFASVAENVSEIDDLSTQQLDQWLDETQPDEVIEPPTEDPISSIDHKSEMPAPPDPKDTTELAGNHADRTLPSPPVVAAAAVAKKTTVVGSLADDFAARRGTAKQIALTETGGDADTEAAVAAALRFLASAQKDDGGWDPAASGAGRERSPLGYRRGGAGTKAETALTGLSLLAMMGSGHTHQEGKYADSVYRGLSRLMSLQAPSGSMAGTASVYSATYCHGMASLALAEAAAMTGDASAIDASRRAVEFTTSMQHPTTGGWRYTKGDPGDLSQLGWQAMVLDGAHRAGIEVKPASVRGIERFLNSVRGGRHGGLASYRRGELPSRTMTAESLATQLLLGLPVTDEAVDETQRYLLGDLPGRGVDNYYYWYYATLALHQLQGDTWTRWNESLKRRLLMTQRGDGSWPADTLWGGYGGTIYTTSMATLCLETYYRHVVREEAKVARTSSLRR